MPDGGTEELLKIHLSAQVPLYIHEMKGLPWAEISKIASEASQFIAEHGDWILYKGPKKGDTAKAVNHLARGLAALSFVPGGVKFSGLHFQARHEGGETAVASHRPVNLTFEKGTLGRFVLRQGLRVESKATKSNPDLGKDPWQRMAAHYAVTIFGPREREIAVNFSKGVGDPSPPDAEEVLAALATDALDAERAQSITERYADIMGYDPNDPAVERELRAMESKATGLRTFLGDEAYRELLEMAEEQNW